MQRFAHPDGRPSPANLARGAQAAHHPASPAEAKIAPSQSEAINISKLRNIGNELMGLELGERLEFHSSSKDEFCGVTKSDPNVVKIHRGELANALVFVKGPSGQIHAQFLKDDNVIKLGNLREPDLSFAKQLASDACEAFRASRGY